MCPHSQGCSIMLLLAILRSTIGSATAIHTLPHKLFGQFLCQAKQLFS
jgi:hypothetical protein